MITGVLIHDLIAKITWEEKYLEEQEGSPDPMPTINPTTNHLKNENNERRPALKEAKQNKKPNINRISKKYNVPRSTLQGHISGRVTHGTKPGPQSYLTAKEEKSLTTHLFDAAKLENG